MVPLSVFPLAITAGNTFVLKPSEKVSGVTNILARIMNKIKLPNGVFNIVQGHMKTVDYILSDDRIKAISFIGQDDPDDHQT